MKDFLLANKIEIGIVGGLLLLSVGIVVLGVIPNHSRAKGLLSQSRSIDTAIEQSWLGVNEVQDILDGAEDEGNLPFDTGQTLPDLLNILAQLGRAHRLEIVYMKPSPAQLVQLNNEAAGISEQTQKLCIDIAVKARYRDVGEYFAALESIPMLVTVKDLWMKRTDANDPTLRVEFRIEAFFVDA